MIRHWLFVLLLLADIVIYAGVLPRSAFADDININAEWDYSHTTAKTDSGNGHLSSSTINDFLQQYTLTLQKTLFPNLVLFANGIYQEDQSKNTLDSVEITTRTKTLQPLVTLTLNSSPYSAALTYNRLQITTNTSGLPSQTLFSNNYSGLFTYKPAGLPELDLIGQRTETYDEQRALEDTVGNRFVVGSRFTPIESLNLSYQYTYNDSKDKLQDTDANQTSNEGRFQYWHSFFNNRVSVTADGNIFRQDSTASFGSHGTAIPFLLSPILGLYAADSTIDSPLGVDLPPHTPANDVMLPTPFLINGGDFIGNVGKLNIGFPKTNPADNNPRDVGVAFVTPTEVNAIYVTVNQDVNSIATSYSWDVYISSDTNIGKGVNPTATQQWTLYQPAATFIFSQIDRTFRIAFQKVTTQFIKVVTRPLPVPASVPGVDVTNILISQIQAFDTATLTSSQAAKAKNTTTSQTYNVNVRARILNTPTIYYDASGFYSSTSNAGSNFSFGQPSQTSYIISNGLSGFYQFNPVFSANARVAREDSYGQQGTGVAYVSNASVTAVPLRTLSHSIVVSTRNETVGGNPNDTSSVFLTNLAELYKGINISLSGGLSRTTTTTTLTPTQENRSEIFTSTLSLMPYKVLTINGDFSWTNSNTTGGGAPDLQTKSIRSDIALTYSPFPTLSLFGSYGIFSGVNVQQTTLTSYGANWSPFPDGTLQFNFAYNQNLASLNSTKDTLIVPSLRWNINKYTFLTISYLAFKSQSIITNVPQHTTQNTFSSILHATF